MNYRMNDTVVVITARGGSKGVPNKNIKPLCGKPLLHYTIETALALFPAERIFVSTDSEAIKSVAEDAGLTVPVLRPDYLATDTAGSYDVLLHAVEFFDKAGISFDKVLLLQPTSPFREPRHIEEAYEAFTSGTEMVTSVGMAKQNPYFTLFEEDGEGYLHPSKPGTVEQRQAAPPVYYYNGSIYLMDRAALQAMPLSKFTRVRKYVMDFIRSMDIDTPIDWLFCETLIEKGLVDNGKTQDHTPARH